MNNRDKRMLAALTAFALSVCAISSGEAVDAAKKLKLSKKKVSLKVGKSMKLKANMKGVKWSSSKKAVAKVSKSGKVKALKPGKAKITAKKGKKKAVCKVTVTKSSDDGFGTYKSGNSGNTNYPGYNVPTTANPSKPVYTLGPRVTIAPEQTVAPVQDDFNFDTDVSIDYGTEIKTVKFKINKDTTSEDELKAQGYTVVNGEATKDTICETATYTFKKLPKSLDSIKQFFETEHSSVHETEYANHDEESNTVCYGGFNVMAATICAANTFVGGSNPSDPFFSKDPVRDMFEYLNGPAETMNLAKVTQDNGIQSMKDAIQSCGSNVYKSYFEGASPDNDYTPSKPYVLKMYRGPYYIPAKETITGKRPTTYMIFAQSKGADSPIYMDVYYSTKNSRWYSYQDQYRHVIANNFKKPSEEL
ncbi:MAG: Ig-like domain-containing protein [Eubacterium sp.]|nr:Ig-like domain-containing protein [Eubacterium sp.]